MTDHQKSSGSDRGSMRIQCSSCGKEFVRRFMPFCDHCGGMTEVSYDLDKVRFRDSTNPYIRFQDILPVHDAALLPADAAYTETVHAKKLGDHLGMANLYLKNETGQPTGTTKDRMAAVSLAYLSECGVRTFSTSSTGNSSTSYAEALGRFPEIKMVVFTAENFRARVSYRNQPRVIHYVMRDATFVEAFEYSGVFARLNDLVSERGFFNLGRREGLKIAFLEAVEQIPRPIDWYVQGISSAMGVHGVYKGAKELHGMGLIPRLPSLLCVQQESCAPMVAAWEEGCREIQPRHIVHHPSGIAEAILRGDPTRAYPIVREIVDESGGCFARVTEGEIRAARKLLLEMEGIDGCFSASTALAGLVKLAGSGKVPSEDTVMVNLTGRNRSVDTDQHRHQDLRWLERSGAGWAVSDPAGDEGMIHSSRG